MNGIPCFPDTKIYIFCPACCATGGPEALHQLGRQLLDFGFDAVMFYYYTDAAQKQAHTHPVHAAYEHYNVPFTNKIDNAEHNLVVLPETHLKPLFNKNISHVRKVVWWLSVVNYNIILQQYYEQVKHKKFYRLRKTLSLFRHIPDISYLRRSNIYHIRHSYYSEHFLLQNRIAPVAKISDYMNDSFFEQATNILPKKDVVIYNPVKNDGFLQKIITATPELTWQAIQGLSPSGVAQVMNQSKVYIDFGYHPGKERMPREACIMRCCLIIGREGSASFDEDMPIPGKYRFYKDRENIPAIISSIKHCLDNYNTAVADFGTYRQALANEKQAFANDVRAAFILQ